MNQPLAIYLVGAVLVVGVLVAVARGLRRRGWVEGEADVTEVVFSRHRFDDGAAGSQLFVVRAEVLSYADFLACGYSEKDAKAKGLMRTEGKTYVVKDADILHILASR